MIKTIFRIIDAVAATALLDESIKDSSKYVFAKTVLKICASRADRMRENLSSHDSWGF